MSEAVFVAGAHAQVHLATLSREVAEGLGWLGVRVAEAAAPRPEDLAAVQPGRVPWTLLRAPLHALEFQVWVAKIDTTTNQFTQNGSFNSDSR